MLTPEQIAARAEQFDGISNIREINRLFRKQDESHLYPVCGRFNVTERAIRRLQRYNREGACIEPGLEYALALENEISHIVNAGV
jgi:hypothetical protein